MTFPRSEKNAPIGPTILVVDDDVVMRRVVVSALKELDCEQIHEVENGLEAKSFLEQHCVDIVITDVLMPELDGLGLIRWAAEHCPGPVWIILSALDTFDAAVDAIHVGAFDFLSKPPQAQQLQIAVRNALRQRNLLREQEALHHQLKEGNVKLSTKVEQLQGLCAILEEQAQAIHNDLRRAEIIQEALLPHSGPAIPGFSVDALYRPGRKVGGDLYDIVRLNDRYTVLYVADASGHGVSAAMLSVLFKQRLQLRDDGGVDPRAPADALATINDSLLRDVSAPGMFITAAYCLLDVKKAEAVVASGGHPPVLCFRADGSLERLERTGPALGLYREATFDQVRLRLSKGDRLLLYTDGLVDDYGTPAAFGSIVNELLTHGDVDSVRRLTKELDRIPGSLETDDRDDVTVLLLNAFDGPSHFDNGEALAMTKPTLATDASNSALLYGESEDATFLGVQARGTWMQADQFYEGAFSALEARRPVIIDLSSCEYLDSTFLGTLHEVVRRGESAIADVAVQSVPSSVAHDFAELSMKLVIEHTLEKPRPLPQTMLPLVGPDDSGRRKHLRVMNAHQILASLSDRNREQFRQVIESLQADLGTE